MRYRLPVFLLLAVATLFVGPLMAETRAGDSPKMTIEDLKGRLGDSDVVVVDVRSGGSWTDSTTKIKGAVREDPKAVKKWMGKYPKDKTLVFYCS
jgi:hypothetical protein